MRNNKGFVMTETLVVTIFLVTIFTFIYVSIVPLIGKYEDLTYRDSDVDIVYKLYHIRKMFNKDANKTTITSNSFQDFDCDDLEDTSCNFLMEYLELRNDDVNNYLLVYANNINDQKDDFQSFNKEMYDYILKYTDFEGHVLVLLDTKNHTIAHLSV